MTRGWRRRLRAALAGLAVDPRAWLVLDPMAHLCGLRWGRPPCGVAVFSPRWPEEMVAAVDVAVSAGVGGILVVDIDGLTGLWGLAGPETALWLPVASAARSVGVPVVSLRRGRVSGGVAARADAGHTHGG